MKLDLLAKALSGATIASLTVLSAVTFSPMPSYAEGATFYCGTSKHGNKSVPTTFARTQDGKRVPIVRWVSNYFPPPWTPRRRCGAVSSKFQRFYDHGILRYITADTLKGQPVLCATPSPGIGCTSDTVLFTLKPGSNPHATIRRLLDRRGLAGGMVLNESSNSVDIDFERYLESGSDEARNKF
ncbi:MAG: COP23 domain-containing protein [Rivularia sp. (in: cyanobacteria)]